MWIGGPVRIWLTTVLVWMAVAFQSSVGAAPRPLFSAPIFKVGDAPRSIAHGDFNGDGYIDLIVANWSSRDLSVLLGDGRGYYQDQRRIPLDDSPYVVRRGDFNGDGHQDLAVIVGASTAKSGKVVTLRGKNDGTFDPPVPANLGEAIARLAVGDLDADGRDDLALSDSQGAHVTIALADGLGRFLSASTHPTVGVPTALKLVDLNNDHALDLVLTHGGATRVVVALGDGHGGIGPQIPFEAGAVPTSVMTGDLNGDGNHDLVIAAEPPQVVVLLGDGAGDFRLSAAVPVQSRPSEPVVQDCNADGRADVVVPTDSGYLNLLSGIGDGALATAEALPITFQGEVTSSVVSADVDEDGRPDLIVTDEWHGLVRVLLSDERGMPGNRGLVQGINQARETRAADVNGDGRLDQIVFGGASLGGTSSIRVFLARDDGSFVPGSSFWSGLWPARVAIGDFNGDGRVDIALVEAVTFDIYGSTSVYVHVGRGDGTFALRWRTRGSAQAVAAADLDGNGTDDVLLAGATGIGRLAASGPDAVDLDYQFQSITGFSSVVAMTTGDLTGDGLLDVAAAHSNGEVSVVPGTGNGHFAGRLRLVAGGTPKAIAAADFDGDNVVDVATIRSFFASSFQGRVSLFFGRGGGAFESIPVELVTDPNPLAIASGDLDGDANADVVVENGYDSAEPGKLSTANIQVYLGRRDRSFTDGGRYTVLWGTNAPVVNVGRFDFDSRPDISLASFGGFQVLFNRGPAADADEDGILDPMDGCHDRDDDGFGDTGDSANGCFPDNCPYAANPGQMDRDGDGRGDTCDGCLLDPMNDPDQDGHCEDADNCPGVANQMQDDQDFDRIGDSCDPCTDTDGDGLGDPVLAASTCPPDNCPGTINADQVDTDGDGIGDACQPPSDRALFPGHVHATGDRPLGMAVADFNADGRPDVAVTNRNSGDISVFLGNAGGLLEPEMRVQSANYGRYIVAGHFDGDTAIDLAVMTDGGEAVILIGRGNGGFDRRSVISKLGQARRFISADLKLDGADDLILVDGNRYEIKLLLNRGDGTFEPPVTLVVGEYAGDVGVADFNEDGVPDLVVPDIWADRIHLMLGNGFGTFTLSSSRDIPRLPYAVTPGDFDADGHVDVAVLLGGGEYFYGAGIILNGAGDGSFKFTTRLFDAGGYDVVMSAGDLNSDGRGDLVIRDYDRDRYVVQLGTENGYFRFTFAGGLQPGAGAPHLADLTADGVLDIAFVDASADTLRIHRGDGAGAVEPPTALLQSAEFMVSDDFNGDGRPDIASAGGVSLGVGDGKFGPDIHLASNVYPPNAITTGDFNEDGRRDLAIAVGVSGHSTDLGRTVVLLGRGDGTFDLPIVLRGGAAPYSLAVADFDGDGHEDLAVVNGWSDDLDVYLGDGRGEFMHRFKTWVGDVPFWVAAGDLNEDGRMDLAIAHFGHSFPIETEGDVAVLIGNGDGTFIIAQRLATGLYPAAVLLSDFDRNSHLDLAAANYGSNDVTMILGRGDGSFGIERRTDVGVGPFALVQGDINGDAVPDLAVSHDVSADVSVLLGAGDGSFAPQSRYPSGPGSLSLAAAHVDGDRRIDVLVGGYDAVTILRNEGPDPDFDGDGIPDPADPCTDLDGDGFGEPHLHGNTCPPDNCPDLPNPTQSDLDGDGRGDACDRCPRDASNDGDRDGICNDLDNCPAVVNFDQSDVDLDASGDACDNCPDVASPDQTDSNGDGAGDACQPYLAIVQIVEDGGENLEVVVEAGDPQGTPLQGSIEIHERRLNPVSLRDFLTLLDCDEVFNPSGSTDGGISYSFESAGFPALFDRDWAAPQVGLSCGDSRPDRETDFVLALRPCATALPDSFQPLVALTDSSPPFTVCVAESDGGYQARHDGARYELIVMSVGPAAIEFSQVETEDFRFEFGGGIPQVVDLPSLVQGAEHTLRMTVTDGATPPISVESAFRYQGERSLLIFGDADLDGIPDSLDPCTDSDGDGAGDPGFPINTCLEDNCPALSNVDQEDRDGDQVGSACDNCPAAANAGQEDFDADGIGDSCDSCTDLDGDGFRDPGWPGECPADNCPAVANTAQEDTDGDGPGDVCDSCPYDPANDRDGDGICADQDNCPDVSNDQSDSDGDGAGDPCDPCTDLDGDGVGDPAYPGNSCAVDNCPAVANIDQADRDGDAVGDACDNCLAVSNGAQQDRDADGAGDACDPCTDSDRDGLGDPGYPASNCPADNCPARPNPDQQDADQDSWGDLCDPCPIDARNDEDADGYCADRDNCITAANDQADVDGDGSGDPCDPCTDTDQDTYGNAGFPANTCATDNCPAVSNPGQEDGDGDGRGDPCDPCPADPLDDADDDGRCADRDNCPSVANNQSDLDGDGFGDACDACTDLDGDGFGDPGFPATTCPPDNCPGKPNSGQADADRDGVGDVCDRCPLDTSEDPDGDGFCSDVDNCPLLSNADQADTDGDGHGDRCDACTDLDGDGFGNPGYPSGVCATDNCPDQTNPDQADANNDGGGDACQPKIAIESVVGGGGDEIQVAVLAADPQRDSLSGRVIIVEVGQAEARLMDLGQSGACTSGLFPASANGAGIGYVNGSVGTPVLFDFAYGAAALGLDCSTPGNSSFALARASCTDATQDMFFQVVELGLDPPPYRMCARMLDAVGQFTDVIFDLVVVEIAPESALIRYGGTREYEWPFAGGIPETIDLPDMSDGVHSLKITVTDGATPSVTAETAFLYQGESRMRFIVDDGNDGPVAVISTETTVECSENGGAPARLSGAGSSDRDSSPGTRDDIVTYEWFEDYGLLSSRPLGVGETLDTTLTLGAHAVTLRVTDRAGAIDTAEVVVTVADTTGPALDCPGAATAECAGAGGAPVTLVATATDACSGAVVVNSWTTGGADASGDFPPGATPVLFTATDGAGNVATCTSSVTVRDTLPPSLGLTTDLTTLWPPNHRLVPVTVGWQTADVCDPAPIVALAGVTSSEPDDAPGNDDGATTGDVGSADAGAADTEIQLRAERLGTGPGRTYEITYTATDASGNRATAVALVTVPHDLGQGPEPLALRLEPGGRQGEARLYWTGVPGATGYDLLQGNVGELRILDGHIDLGTVQVLGRGLTGTALVEEGLRTAPRPGRAFFYVMQWREGERASGYGTESAPLPRRPESCGGGCP